MRNLLDYFRLMRWSNLLFIALIQFLMSRAVLQAILHNIGLDYQEIPIWILVLIILATILIAAGGYVINDYFDIKIDRINRPEKVIITRSIDKKDAMRFYQLLTISGTIIGFVVAGLLKSISLAFIFFVIPGILWFYSSSYKRQFLLGNLTIAFCSALVPLTIAVAQIAFLGQTYSTLIYEVKIPQICYEWVGGFALFAFLTTLLREIIKDIQDEFGDRQMECRTLPILLGIRIAKIVVYVLLVVIMALLAYFVFSKLASDGSNITERYFIFGIVLPTIFCIYFVYKAQLSSDYKVVSNLVKFMMLTGTLYSLVLLFYDIV